MIPSIQYQKYTDLDGVDIKGAESEISNQIKSYVDNHIHSIAKDEDGEYICPVCFEEVENKNQYCPLCGTRLERLEDEQDGISESDK